MPHDDCLDHLAIVSFEEGFRGLSSFARDFMMDREARIEAVLSEESSYLFRESLDLLVVGFEIFINGILDLSIAKLLVSVSFEEGDDPRFVVDGEHFGKRLRLRRNKG